MLAMAVINAALWYVFLTGGQGSYWEGTLRAVTTNYFFPGVVLELAVGIGIPVFLLSGARLAQLLLPGNAWLTRRSWIRPASNAVLAIVFLALAAQLPEDDAVMDPIKRLFAGEKPEAPQLALRSDGEMKFPALPYVAEPDPWISLEFDGLDGKKVKWSDLRGKAVFLNFWATWCKPCRAEMPNIENLYTQMKDDADVAFLLVSYEDTETVNAFLSKNPHTAPIYTIPEETLDRLKIRSYPTTKIFSKTGEEMFSHTGAIAWDSGTTKVFLQALARDLPFSPPPETEKKQAGSENAS